MPANMTMEKVANKLRSITKITLNNKCQQNKSCLDNELRDERKKKSTTGNDHQNCLYDQLKNGITNFDNGKKLTKAIDSVSWVGGKHSVAL